MNIGIQNEQERLKKKVRKDCGRFMSVLPSNFFLYLKNKIDSRKVIVHTVRD